MEGPVKQGNQSRGLPAAVERKPVNARVVENRPLGIPRCCQRWGIPSSRGWFASGDAQVHVQQRAGQDEHGLEFTVRAWHGISASYVGFLFGFLSESVCDGIDSAPTVVSGLLKDGLDAASSAGVVAK